MPKLRTPTTDVEQPRAIMTRLGHASNTTVDTYGRLMGGLDERTADRLDDVVHSAETAQSAQAPWPIAHPTTRTRFELALPA